MALVANWPHPVLVLQGEQGSGKSTASRMIKGLIDPGVAPIRSAPSSPRDLAVGAEGNWIVPVDNLSGVPPWLSDAWCRLSTGAGSASARCSPIARSRCSTSCGY
jgi:putative DNA primase/helicase